MFTFEALILNAGALYFAFNVLFKEEEIFKLLLIVNTMFLYEPPKNSTLAPFSQLFNMFWISSLAKLLSMKIVLVLFKIVSVLFLDIALYLLLPSYLVMMFNESGILEATFIFAFPLLSVILIWLWPFKINVIFWLDNVFPNLSFKVTSKLSVEFWQNVLS